MMRFPDTRSILPVLLLAFTFILPLAASGAAPQVDWIRSYGGAAGDQGFDAVALPGGGYLLVGKTASAGAGGDDVYLVAVDEDGDVLWERVHGGAAHDVGRAVIRTRDGGFAVTGHTGIPPLDYRALLMKLDAEGRLEWQASFAGDGPVKGRDLVQTADDGYLLVAEDDFRLIRTDDQGVLAWERNLGGAGDRATSLSEASDGAFFLTGYHSDGRISPEHDARLLKVTGKGVVLLNRTYDLGAEDQVHGAIELDGGDIVFCGISGGTGSLWRATAGGGVIWRKAFPAKHTSGLLETADGGFLIAGTTYAYDNGQYQVALTQTDSAGEILGQTEAGGAAFDLAEALVPTEDGAVVAGSAQPTDGTGYNVLAVRYAVELAPVAAVGDPVPTASLQLRNYPNPFNPGTTIRFVNPTPGGVRLQIFDSRGRRVRTLVDGRSFSAGPQEVFWDGLNDDGRALAAGVYYSQLVAGDMTANHRMTLLK